MKLPSKAKHNYLALAFAIPFLGMLMVMLFSGYKPFGKYSMLYSDMYHQYYPFFVAFRQTLRGGHSLLYSWNIGMGVDYLGLIAYYLASPLNLLSLLIPESLLLHYFSLLVPIKLGVAGCCFACLLKNIFHKNDPSIAIFGGFYGVCAWALGYQWNVMWLDSFAILPLVILGEISLLRERKFLLYTITLFLSIFANYYIGLFTCIFVALVFFCYELCSAPGWKRFFTDLGCMALFSAIAIGLTAILTVPALASLQTTQSSVNKFPTDFRLNIAPSNTLMGLLDGMRQVAGNMGGGLEPTFKEGLPNLYCGVGTIFFAFLFLVGEEGKIREKFCCILLILFFNISFLVRQLDYIWHGFHFTNMIPYRFSFLHSFVLLVMAYRGYLQRKKYDWLQVISAFFLTAAILCCSNDLLSTKNLDFLNTTWKIPVYAIYNGTFLILFLAAVLYGTWQGRKPEDEQGLKEWTSALLNRRSVCNACLFGVAFSEIIITLLSFGLYFPGTSVSNYPRGKEEAASMIRYMHEKEKNTLFYRAEVTHTQTLNDGALNNYNGISTFTSSANVRVTEFMKALGYGAKNTYNRYAFEESSPVANLFLDLKYMIDREGKDRTSSVFSEVHHYGKVMLLKNEAYLPLGFLSKPELAQLDFQSADNMFAFQNDLFTAATGMEAEIWYRVKGDHLTVYGDAANVMEDNHMGYCTYDQCGSGSAIVYAYTADRDGFACIHLNLPKRNNFHVFVNGFELYQETISLPQMLAVQDVSTGDLVEIRVDCSENESGTMSVQMAIMDNDLFFAGFEQLSQSVWHLDTFRDTYVSGTISCAEDGYLYTSIPDNGNWKVTVDGKSAQTVLTGECMIGVMLGKGDHTVSFRYDNRSFSIGWKISLACAIMLAVLYYVYDRPRTKTRGKFQK